MPVRATIATVSVPLDPRCFGGSPLDRRPPANAKTRREERRARRLAERDADRERTRRKATRPPWQDPTAIVTVGALVVGLVLVILLVVRPGSSSGQPLGSGNPYGLIKPDVSFPANLANGRSIGKADAPVTLDVWADFQCPFCGQFARSVEPEIVADLVAKGTVRLVAHDFSFLGARRDPDESTDAAVAARCADKQGKFWDYYEMLFWNQGTTENGGAFAQTRLVAMAGLLGLDETSFVSCLADPTIAAAVVAETDTGRQAGVASTPTTFINGTAVVGLKDYATMKSLIEAAAAKASPAAGAPSGSAPSSPGASASP